MDGEVVFEMEVFERRGRWGGCEAVAHGMRLY